MPYQRVACEFHRPDCEEEDCAVAWFINGAVGMSMLSGECPYRARGMWTRDNTHPQTCPFRLLGIGHGPKRDLRIPAGPGEGFAAIKGQWPGDETDAEISEALRGLS